MHFVVHLDKVYVAAEARDQHELPSPPPPSPSPLHPLPPPPPPASLPPPPSNDSPDYKAFNPSFNEDFVGLMEELQIQEGLATQSVNGRFTEDLEALKKGIDEDFAKLMEDL